MKTYNRYPKMALLCFLCFITLFIPTQSAKADMVPKPTMDFYFQDLQNNVSVLEGKLLLCSNASCDNYTEFPEHFDCSSNHCIAWGVIPPFVQYHKVIITFTDGIRESQIFTKRGYNAQYNVQVLEDRLIIKEELRLGTFFNPLLLICFSAALLLTITVESLVAIIYIRLKKIKMAFLLRVILANVVSLPIVWFVIYQMIDTNELTLLFIAEIFVIILEAILMTVTGRKFGITIKQALLLSLVMNCASVLVGWLIILILSGTI